MKKLFTGLFLSALVFGALAGVASAHSLSSSYSNWKNDGTEVEAVFILPLIEFARSDDRFKNITAEQFLVRNDLVDSARDYLVGRVKFGLPEDGCTFDKNPVARALDSGRVSFSAKLACTRPPAPLIGIELFFDRAPGHLHFIKLINNDGASLEDVLSAENNISDLRPREIEAEKKSGETSLFEYILIGLEHVSGGFDHIAFIIGLLLLGGGAATIIKIATGFTIAHSITLGLAAAGFARPNEAGVEVMVGLSIAYVALERFFVAAAPENRWRVVAVNIAVHSGLIIIGLVSDSPLPPAVAIASLVFTGCHLRLHAKRPDSPAAVRAAVAFFFGLTHGFAFAGAFSDLFSGTGLLKALFGFNVGVEIGQLVIILIAAPLYYLINRRGGERAGSVAVGVSAAFILALGIGWTFTRALQL